MSMTSFWNEAEGESPIYVRLIEEDLYRKGPRMVIRNFLYHGKSLNDFELIIETIGGNELNNQYAFICDRENAFPVFNGG